MNGKEMKNVCNSVVDLDPDPDGSGSRWIRIICWIRILLGMKRKKEKNLKFKT